MSQQPKEKQKTIRAPISISSMHELAFELGDTAFPTDGMNFYQYLEFFKYLYANSDPNLKLPRPRNELKYIRAIVNGQQAYLDALESEGIDTRYEQSVSSVLSEYFWILDLMIKHNVDQLEDYEYFLNHKAFQKVYLLAEFLEDYLQETIKLDRDMDDPRVIFFVNKTLDRISDVEPYGDNGKLHEFLLQEDITNTNSTVKIQLLLTALKYIRNPESYVLELAVQMLSVNNNIPSWFIEENSEHRELLNQMNSKHTLSQNQHEPKINNHSQQHSEKIATTEMTISTAFKNILDMGRNSDEYESHLTAIINGYDIKEIISCLHDDVAHRNLIYYDIIKALITTKEIENLETPEKIKLLELINKNEVWGKYNLKVAKIVTNFIIGLPEESLHEHLPIMAENLSIKMCEAAKNDSRDEYWVREAPFVTKLLTKLSKLNTDKQIVNNVNQKLYSEYGLSDLYRVYLNLLETKLDLQLHKGQKNATDSQIRDGIRKENFYKIAIAIIESEDQTLVDNEAGLTQMSSAPIALQIEWVRSNHYNHDQHQEFITQFEKANAHADERYQRDIDIIMMDHIEGFINLYQALGNDMFPLLKSMCGPSVLELERFLENYQCLSKSYRLSVDALLDNFKQNNTPQDYSNLKSSLLLLGSIQQLATELKLSNIEVKHDIDNTILQLAQNAKNNKEFTTGLATILKELYVDLLQIPSTEIDTSDFEQNPLMIGRLLTARNAMQDNALAEVFDQLLAADLLNDHSFDQFANATENNSELGTRLAQHNQEIRTQLNTSGVDTQTAFNYQKTAPFSTGSSESIDLLQIKTAIWNDIVQLKEALEEDDTTLRNQIEKFQKHITRGKKGAPPGEISDLKLEKLNTKQLHKLKNAGDRKLKKAGDQSTPNNQQVIEFAGHFRRDCDLLNKNEETQSAQSLSKKNL